MRCTSPRTVGFLSDGKTISWSQKHYSKEYSTFQLPCGKCLSCRLEYSRQWAIRCVHEAQMHEKNSFITLTYDDEHLGDPKLDYRDFQLFMKKLRKTQNEPIGFFVTGEYGEKSKRKHWHAILFNYQPKDLTYKYTTERGHRVDDSSTLTRLWGHGITECGSVTFESAGYCARYAAKKLVHGRDEDHGYNPISKKSNKRAIGKSWLEKYWADVFLHGRVVLADGSTCGVPRYYEKWFKENHPEKWAYYVTNVKQKIMDDSQKLSEKEELEWRDINWKRLELGRRTFTLKAIDRTRIILADKFKKLQEYLKL